MREARDRIVATVGMHVVFDGWSLKSLKVAAQEVGLGREAAIRAFPRGVGEAITHYFDWCDRRMLAAMMECDLPDMKMRERVGTAVLVRLNMSGDREVVRRTLSVLALPMYTHVGLRATYSTVDAIWHAAGDTTTDIGFYTKRALLVGVYTATLLYWLNDVSKNGEDTRRFLERRLANIAQASMLRLSLVGTINVLLDPMNLFRFLQGTGLDRERWHADTTR